MKDRVEHLNDINDNNVCYKLIDDNHILLLLPSYIYYHLLKIVLNIEKSFK